jgi:hypothetical protein
MEPRVIDFDGNERPFSWAAAKYGAVYTPAEPFEGRVLRLIELREQDGPALQMTHVQDEDGKPVAGVEVCRWWPDVPDDLPEEALGENHKPVSYWFRRGVHGPTNTNGDQAFGVGGDDVVITEGPDAIIKHAVWLASWDAPSDLYQSKGVWIGGTNHRHLACIFELQTGAGERGEGPPSEGPPSEGLPSEGPPGEGPAPDQPTPQLPTREDVLAALDRAQAAIEEARRLLGG